MKLKIWVDEGWNKGISRRSLYKIKRLMRWAYLKTPYRQRAAKIIHSHKAIYFDIPKVATSSIFYLIFNGVYGKEKKGYYEMYEMFPQVREIDLKSEWFREYYKFAFVRNPYSRIVSCYTDLIVRQKIKEIIQALGITKDATFKEFVVAVSKKSDNELSELDPHIRPQHLSLYKNDKLLVDYIGRVENLNDEINFIFKKIGIKEVNKVPEINKTSKNNSDYKKYYDDEIIKIVGERYKKDLELFGYEF